MLVGDEVVGTDFAGVAVGLGQLAGEFEDYKNKKSCRVDLSFTGDNKKVYIGVFIAFVLGERAREKNSQHARHAS